MFLNAAYNHPSAQPLMPSYAFSNATHAETADIDGFHTAVALVYPGSLKPRDEKAIAAFIAAGNQIILAKNMHGFIIGMVMLQVSALSAEQQHDYCVPATKNLGLVKGFAAVKGHGLGSKLLERVEQEAHLHGVKTLLARVQPDLCAQKRFMAKGYRPAYTAADGKKVMRLSLQS